MSTPADGYDLSYILDTQAHNRACDNGHDRVDWHGLPGCWVCHAPGDIATPLAAGAA